MGSNRFQAGMALAAVAVLGSGIAFASGGDERQRAGGSARPDRALELQGCELSAAPRSGQAGPDHDARAHDVRFQCPGDFGRHRLSDLPGFTVLGQQAAFVAGYDFSPDGAKLYALKDHEGVRQLGTSDPETGAFTPIGTSTPLPGHFWTGLAIDPMLGTIYAASSDERTTSTLYTLDPDTGAASVIGSTMAAELLIAIAMNCAGELYGHDIVADALYAIDPATGAATLIGETGVDSNFAQGMDFDNPTGALYAWTYQGGGANQYGTLDLATGVLTPLSIDDPFAEFEAATLTYCPPFALIFSDGFESGDTGAWDQTAG